MFGTIIVRGDDARSFLQGQLTQDIDAVREGCSPLSAWCTPKGRVVAILRLLDLPDGIAMVLPASLVEPVITGLQRYRLRARADLADTPGDWQCLAVANEADLATLQSSGLLPDAQSNSSRRSGDITAVSLDPARQTVELYGNCAALALRMPLSDTHWREARIRAGIADVTPANSGKFTPHMLNLDQIAAVSFDKGCYAGQEIVARTQYLGNAKRRAAAFTASSKVAAGDSVDLDGTAVGEIVASAGRHVLALLPVDLHGSTLSSNKASLTPASG